VEKNTLRRTRYSRDERSAQVHRRETWIDDDEGVAASVQVSRPHSLPADALSLRAGGRDSRTAVKRWPDVTIRCSINVLS
jgi:hypothetical protein